MWEGRGVDGVPRESGLIPCHYRSNIRTALSAHPAVHNAGGRCGNSTLARSQWLPLIPLEETLEASKGRLEHVAQGRVARNVLQHLSDLSHGQWSIRQDLGCQREKCWNGHLLEEKHFAVKYLFPHGGEVAPLTKKGMGVSPRSEAGT